MFHNYAFNKCISVENLKLWLLMLMKTLFLKTIIIKLTLCNIFIKVEKYARAAPLPQNSWHIFQMQINPLLWDPQGPQGCLEKQNCPLHRGAFWHFSFRWIYYYGSNKSSGKETGKTHLCALCQDCLSCLALAREEIKYLKFGATGAFSAHKSGWFIIFGCANTLDSKATGF